MCTRHPRLLTALLLLLPPSLSLTAVNSASRPVRLLLCGRCVHLHHSVLDSSCSEWARASPVPCRSVARSPSVSSVPGGPRQEHWRELLFPTPGGLPYSGVGPATPVFLVLHVDSLLLSRRGSPHIKDIL